MEKKIIFCLAFFAVTNLNPAFSQLSLNSIIGITNEFGSDVETKLLEENGSPIGTFTVIKRSSKRAKAKFFAFDPNRSESAYSRFLQWQRTEKKRVILLTSAGFSSSLNYPICKGFCVEEGIEIGSTVDGELDGLVFIYGYGGDAGGVALVDLDQDFGKLAINGLEYRPRLLPFEFSKACREAGAFAFQSQLFYFNNRERFSRKSSSFTAVPRRYFAVVRKNGEVSHIVIHIPKNVRLTEYAEKSFNLIRSSGYEVVGLLNFDTGWYDYFRLYFNNSKDYYGSLTGGDGETISLIGAQDSDIRKATNFVVYYYD